MKIHPREKKVTEAELKLRGCLLEIMNMRLTNGEYLRVVGNVIGSDLCSIAKWMIREERHPEDMNKPGGLDTKIVSKTANTTVVEIGGKAVLFSYKTPVAAFVPGTGYIKTDKFHSRTTSKHIGQFLNGAKASYVDQDILDTLAGAN